MEDLYSNILRSLLEDNTWANIKGEKKSISFTELPNGIKVWLKGLEDRGESINKPGEKTIIKMPQPKEVNVIDTDGKGVTFDSYVSSFTQEYSQFFSIKELNGKLDVEPVGKLTHRGESNYFTKTSSGSVGIPVGKLLAVYSWNSISSKKSFATLTLYINNNPNSNQLATNKKEKSLPSNSAKKEIKTVRDFALRTGINLTKEEEVKLEEVLKEVLKDKELMSKAYYKSSYTLSDVLMDATGSHDVEDAEKFIKTYSLASVSRLVDFFKTKLAHTRRSSIHDYENAHKLGSKTAEDTPKSEPKGVVNPALKAFQDRIKAMKDSGK